MKHAFTSGLRVPPPTEMGAGPKRGMVDILRNEGGWHKAEAYKASRENDSAHCHC